MNKNIAKILIKENEIKDKIKIIARKISKDYKGKNLILIGVLKGSIFFLSDLYRYINIECEIDFITISSYDGNLKQNKNIEIFYKLCENLENKNVLIVEDILDTGNTLKFVKDEIEKYKPKSVSCCVLLNKNIKRKVEIEVDYKCFDVEDEFVVGYGLDYKEKYRNLPFIGILKL